MRLLIRIGSLESAKRCRDVNHYVDSNFGKLLLSNCHEPMLSDTLRQTCSRRTVGDRWEVSAMDVPHDSQPSFEQIERFTAKANNWCGNHHVERLGRVPPSLRLKLAPSAT